MAARMGPHHSYSAGDRPTSASKSLRILVSCALVTSPLWGVAQDRTPGPEMVLMRATEKSPEAIVEAVKTYAEAHKWIYMGANKAKKGEVTMVKVCIPEVGQILWPVGLHVSALLPCGNVGVYQKQARPRCPAPPGLHDHALSRLARREGIGDGDAALDQHARQHLQVAAAPSAEPGRFEAAFHEGQTAHLRSRWAEART
jgi:hypothetical protein